jgi:hypothetical protein
MELKYVGDLPRVSQHGVSFDHTKTDKYMYLHAILELLEALSYGPTETTQHLYKTEHKELKPKELLAGLQKYVKNLDDVYEQRVSKAKEMVDELKARVHENENLTPDEKRAWLNNIDIMTDYYLQYVTNKSVYEAALEALADEIAAAKVLELRIPMFRNYGIVVDDLKDILERRKSPIDTSFEVNSTDEGIIGTVKFSHNTK